MLLLKNCLIIYKDAEVIKDILIEKNKIVQIDDDIVCIDAKVIDVEKNLVSPGFIDMHAHLREPGYTHKETIKTATKAAVHGGYTTICAMPNTNPVIDTNDKVIDFLKKVKKDAFCKVKTFGAITKNLNDTKLVDIQKMSENVCGFSNDGLGIQSASVMYSAMEEVKKSENFIAAHCEDESMLFGGYVHKGAKSYIEGWKDIHSLSEILHVVRDILLSEVTGCRYHVCHISAKESIKAIREAKGKGINVTCEVTPHHLILSDTSISSAQYKMNPPLRSIEDKYTLLSALLDGTIDVIATDHAPHTEEEKSKGLKEAPFGIVGLETAFPLIYTNIVKTGFASHTQIIEWFSVNPSKILNLKYGHIVENRIADLTIIDIKTKKMINTNDFQSMGKNTPFEGYECTGFPIITIVDGQIIYEKGKYNEYIKDSK